MTKRMRDYKSKHHLLMTIFAALLAVLVPQQLAAYDFMVDGLCYNITSGTTVEVTYQNSSSPMYTDLSSNLTIPETVTYNGITYSVTSIGNDAFRGSSSLTSVTIPNSVATIGNNAFWTCFGLTSVTIPNSVTAIGYNAFSGTAWFNNQPDGLVYAGLNAYKYKGTMPAGTSIAIKEGTKSISSDCFSGCSGLTSLTIPNSVATIGNNAFKGTAWFDNQPDGLVYAGLNAYVYKGTMPAGTSIAIKEGTKSISSYCFRGCSGLTSVTIPNSVTSIGNYTFSNCSGLTSVTIPNSVTAIGVYTFSNCSGLISVSIPNSVTAIGNNAFKGCSGLTSVSIPNSVTHIDDYAFTGCSGLESIKVASGNRVYDSRNDCNAIIETGTNTLIFGCKTSTIPNSVTAIGDYAFNGCSGLTSVSIPNSVTRIGNYAFTGCRGLESIKVASSNRVYDSRNDCNAIIETGTNTLIFGCKTSSIPNSVTAIGDYAFEGCSGLASVSIPNSVTRIGNCAFRTCIELASVTIGNSVCYIGDGAFGGCIGLISVIIPNSVTSIGDYAFEGCRGMSSVTIPNSITSIGRRAFTSCSALTTIDSDIIHPSEITMGEYVFNNVPTSSCSLYVIEESLSEYQATSPWNEFNIIAKTIRLKADTIHYVRGTGNTVVELPIELVNYKTLSGLQFDMSLGGNMSFNLRNGVPDIWLDDNRKARNHTVAVERQSEGSEHYRVLVSSPTSQSLKGNDGVLLHANMQINKYGSAGLFPIGYSNITMAAPDETQYHQDPWQSYLSYEYIVGDANADTQVNVGDFGVTANKILNREVNSLYFDDAANVNQDYVVNVADLVGIANIALGIRPKEIRRSPAMHDAQSIMHDTTSLHASTDGNRIAIALDNEVAIAGLQMDIVLPQGVTVAHAQLQGRAAGHDLQVATLPDGRVRLLVAAFSDRDIAAGDDTIMTLTLDGDIDGVATIGGTAAERSLISHELDEVCVPMGTTGIDGTTACNEVRIYGRNGNIVIDSPTAGTTQLVMLNGITRDLNVKAGRNTYPMPSGYYIVRMAGATAKVKI